jgi:hypothetical protein
MNEMLSPETLLVIAKGLLALGYLAIGWVAVVLVRGFALEAGRALARAQGKAAAFPVEPIASRGASS